MNVDLIIPAYNEEQSIALVLGALPVHVLREVVVVDNNSSDHTAAVARQFGASVLSEKEQGYGAACLCGINYLRTKTDVTDVIVFMDADFSDYPEEMAVLIEPILRGEVDFVIGSRVRRYRERGAMLPQQLFGNWLATFLIRMLYGVKYYDLGPFRAIRYSSLLELDMKDRTYGWTVEMQLKAIQKKLRWKEVPVHYRKRKGVSKISGTVKGTFLAGYKIISTIIKYR